MHLGNDQKLNKKRGDYDLVPVYNERRQSHTWVIGKAGVGKSTALLRWASADIESGCGLAFFDPMGQSAEALLNTIPATRRKDVIWFDPSEFPISINPFHAIPKERRSFVASSLVDTFKSVWGYSGVATPTLDMFLYNGARALLDMQDGTLFGLKYLLTNPSYRKRVISYIEDPVIADFWKIDFDEHMSEREQREKTLSTLNKIGAMNSDPFVRNLIAHPKSKLDFREIIRSGKILLVSLPQGRLGADKSSLIGSMLLSQLYLAASENAGTDTNKDFHIYVDGCQAFASDPLLDMLANLRSANVSLTLSNQYLDQLAPKLKSALIGTVGTIVAFQIGALDAQTLEAEFKLYPDDYSLCELNPYKAYIRSGLATRLLSMPDYQLFERPGVKRKLKNLCRTNYAVDVPVLEKRLAAFLEFHNNE